jgi:hypothetical protein
MGASKSEYRKAMLYVQKVLRENLGSEIYVLIEIVMVFLSPHVKCHGSSSNEIIMASVHIIGNAFFTNKHHWPSHGSGGYSLASHCGGPGSHPVQSMLDLWWTK